MTVSIERSFIECLLSKPTTTDITTEIAQKPDLPHSLLSSCVAHLLKNGIRDANKVHLFCHIVLKVHHEAIALGLAVTNVYESLKMDLLQYTVNAPPFSREIFSLNDFKVMSVWICEIYLKHYKMWLYRDGRKELATVAALAADDFSKSNNLMQQVQPVPLGESLPEEKWQEQEAQQHQEENEANAQHEQKSSQEQDNEPQHDQDQSSDKPEEDATRSTSDDNSNQDMDNLPEREDSPDIKNAYIKRQLDSMMQMLRKFSDDKLQGVEEKLRNIETVVQEKEEQVASKGKKKK